MRKEAVDTILQETEEGYDLVAEKFSATRKYFWRGLEFIKDYARDGDRVLDFGCGNGRLLELFHGKNLDYTGVDVSQKLIDIASRKYSGKNIKFSKISSSPRTKATNEGNINLGNQGSAKEVYLNQDDSQRLVWGRQDILAFPDNYFNVIYSIAVFHHFPKAHAQKMARELFRTAKLGGYAVVTVWNLYQKKYLKNILKNWWSKLRGDSQLDWKGCRVNFQDNAGKIFPRYHHAYTKNELKKIFFEAGFRIEICRKTSRGNIILVVKKDG